MTVPCSCPAAKAALQNRPGRLHALAIIRAELDAIYRSCEASLTGD